MEKHYCTKNIHIQSDSVTETIRLHKKAYVSCVVEFNVEQSDHIKLYRTFHGKKTLY